MTYLRGHRDVEKKKSRNIAIISSVIIAAVLLVVFLAPHSISGFFQSIAAPFWRMEFSINSGSLNSQAYLLKENEDLKSQLSSMQTRLDTIRAVEEENIELKRAFNRASTTPGILAAVLERPPIASYDQFIIDIGEDYNITKGDAVYASGDVLVGYIADVFTHTSRVILLSSPGQKYEVLVGAQHSAATAIGKGGGQYEAEISRDLKVNAGDFVLTSSLNEKPFGVVSAVVSDPADPFEKVLFAPPINIYDVRWVLVRKK